MTTDGQPPRSVRWIWGARDALEARPWRWVTIVVVAFLVVGTARGFYTVSNGESAAVLRFGRLIDDAVAPGLRFRLPFGIDRVIKTRTGEVYRKQVEGDDSTLRHLVTGDENLIDAAIAVQYRITRLGDYLYGTEDVEELVAQSIGSELVESAAALGVDDLLTSAKALVQQDVRQRAQERLEAYGSGVVLVSVNLLSVDPPREAEAAFRDVVDARAKAAETVSRARADRTRGQSLASGASAQLVGEAEAEANRRVRAAEGAVERFEGLLVQKRLSPGLTRADLYARIVRDVLPRTRLIVLAPGDAGDIDVNLVEKGRP